MGDRVDLLIPLNQDSIDRHLRLLTAGAACIYNADTNQARHARGGCAALARFRSPTWLTSPGTKWPQNTLAIALAST